MFHMQVYLYEVSGRQYEVRARTELAAWTKVAKRHGVSAVVREWHRVPGVGEIKREER
jgi:hypothetical protein